MAKCTFALLTMTLIPACVYAVDGVVLINQATVNAAGGFPYVISQPGSYKLTGNLTAPLNKNAIEVSASLVTLDLNGFNVSCSADPGKVVNCITDTASIAGFTLMNGGVRTDLSAPVFDIITITAVNIGSPYSKTHDLVVVTAQSGSGPGIRLGSFSSIQKSTVIGPSSCGGFCSVVENIFAQPLTAGVGSVLSANVTI